MSWYQTLLALACNGCRVIIFPAGAGRRVSKNIAPATGDTIGMFANSATVDDAGDVGLTTFSLLYVVRSTHIWSIVI